MNKTIVTIPSSDIRQAARKGLRGSWKTGALAVLLMEVVIMGPDILLTVLFPSGALSAVLNLYSLLVGAPLALGMTMLFLNIARGKETGPAEVFYGFEYLIKAIGLQLVVGFFTFLWFLLFIVPGFIAAYRYSLAFYILADDPGKGIMQCMNESKYLTMGNKAKMFCLDFSFFGWACLCALPPAIFGGMFAFNTLSQMNISAMTQHELMATMQQMPSFSLGVTLASVGYLLLIPYMTTATACLYDLINGSLRICRVEPGYVPPIQSMYGSGESEAGNGRGAAVSLTKPEAEEPKAGEAEENPAPSIERKEEETNASVEHQEDKPAE